MSCMSRRPFKRLPIWISFYKIISGNLKHLTIKGGHLDFSHLTEFKNVYVTEIFMKKQYKSSKIKNHEITEKGFFDGVPLKGYVAS